MNEEEKELVEGIKQYPTHRELCLIHVIERLDEELDKKNKVISKMGEEIEDITGSCPLDRCDWENKKCDNCNNTYKECFIEYFYKKVEEENE